MSEDELRSSLASLKEKWDQINMQEITTEVGTMAKDVVEKGKKFNATHAVILQKSQAIMYSDQKVPKDDIGKVIRLLQKEIESVTRRYNDSIALIEQLRTNIAQIEDPLPQFNQALSFLQSAETRKSTIEQSRADLDALGFQDQEVAALESEIAILRQKHNDQIQESTQHSLSQIEMQNIKELDQISADISALQTKIADAEQQIPILRSEITAFQQQKTQSKQKEQDEIERFDEETGRLDSEIVSVRNQISTLSSVNVTYELQQASSQLADIEADIADIPKIDIAELRQQVSTLRDKRSLLETELEAAPQLSQWREAQAELRVHRSMMEDSADTREILTAIDVEKKCISQLHVELTELESELNLVRDGDLSRYLMNQNGLLRTNNAKDEAKVNHLKHDTAAIDSRCRVLRERKVEMLIADDDRPRHYTPWRRFVSSAMVVLKEPIFQYLYYGYVALLHILFIILIFA